MKFRVPFNNPRGAVAAILVFVLLFTLFRCQEVEASETLFEAGVGVLSGELSEGTMVLVTERFAGKYDIGIGLVSQQRFAGQDVPNNMVLRAARVVRWREVELSLGIGVWANTTRVVSQEETFDLGAAWEFSPHNRLHIRHWSNAGQQPTNLGQDYIGYSRAF